MKIKKSIIFLMLIIATLVFAAGCGANNTASSDKTTKKSAANSSDVKGTVFKFYNKVEIGETKSDVDKALAVTPEADTHSENAYNYVGSDKYGVFVTYDKDSKATSKTVIYSSHSDIASLFKKSFTQDQSNKITSGMTYDQVVKLLGDDGAEVNKTLASGESQPGLMRRWANKDGSCIQVVFRANDTVQYSMFYSGDK